MLAHLDGCQLCHAHSSAGSTFFKQLNELFCMDIVIGISSETLTNSTYCQSPFMFSCENYFDYSLYENKHLTLHTLSVFFFMFGFVSSQAYILF